MTRTTIITGWAKLLIAAGLLGIAVGGAGTEPDPPVTVAPDPFSIESEKFVPIDFYQQEKKREAARERQEQFRKRISIKDAVGDDVPIAFTRRYVEPAAPVAKAENLSAALFRQGLLLLAAMVLSFVVILRLVAPALFNKAVRKLNPLTESGPAADALNRVRSEDEAFAAFVASFQAGPSVPTQSEARADGVGGALAPVDLSRLLAGQRSLLEQIERSNDDGARRRILADLGREMQAFKNEIGAPGLLPAWQMTCALAGLLKQLTDKAGNVTRSTLRTVTAATELLGELCRPDIRKDLLNHPPLKFLAVDDDLVSRTAVAMSLQKALARPDVAEDGATALALATEHSYDVIFLDVQMAGMDGFELCERIHETKANRNTPVVFVTGMNDYEARAQSLLSGGADLLGKPFLTFEITVKALTLALGRRLLASAVVAPATDRVETTHAFRGNPATTAPAVSDQPTGDHQSAAAVPDENLAEVFAMRATTHLGLLPEKFHAVATAQTAPARQEALAAFYVAMKSLTQTQSPVVIQPLRQLQVALDGLTKKLLKHPKHWTSSALATLHNALALWDDFHVSARRSDRWDTTPLRLLVVDDDLVSRRAVVGALQNAFDKPAAAENGEAAVSLATAKPFDLIFMDVYMPRMDGFTACANIRQTSVNAQTPVVFVTGQYDGPARARAAFCGGNDLIAKPILPAELTVKALTFAWRNRLEKSGVTSSTEFLVATDARAVAKAH